jgi:MerR family copper efflux transcriptional regulator
MDLFGDGLMIGARSTISPSLRLLLALGQVPADLPEGFASLSASPAKGLSRPRLAFTAGTLTTAVVEEIDPDAQDEPKEPRLVAISFNAQVALGADDPHQPADLRKLLVEPCQSSARGASPHDGVDPLVHYRVHTSPMNAPSLSIGEVARSAGVGVETVRFYEREGLVPEPARRPSGYRQYPPDTVRRIRFVQAAKKLGFTLKEIRQLLSLRVAAESTCADVRDLALAKLADVNAKLAALLRIRDALARLAASCTGEGPTSECPLLDVLDAHGDSDAHR